jgi:hypothetical protein
LGYLKKLTLKKNNMKIASFSTRYIKLLLVFTMLFSACKKTEVLESRELLVYLQGGFGELNNRVLASLTQTPTGTWGEKVYKIPMYTTREVPDDVVVTIKADEGKVARFNTDNNLQTLMLPANSFKFNSSQHTIKAGTFFLNSIEVEITDPSVLTNPQGYVLPVTISNLESKDRGVKISSNRATAYLYIPYNYSNVDSTQTPLAGTVMPRTGWSVTVSNTTTGALGPAMLDGNNSTAWRSNNTATAAKWVVLNMGSSKTIKGFRITPNYVVTAENATQIIVSSSPDNVNWTVQGRWRGTGPAAGTSAASPDFKGLNFITPVQSQYFRFEIVSWVSGSRVGIAELNAFE